MGFKSQSTRPTTPTQAPEAKPLAPAPAVTEPTAVAPKSMSDVLAELDELKRAFASFADTTTGALSAIAKGVADVRDAVMPTKPDAAASTTPVE